MGVLSSKPFVVIDLGSGKYVQTKVGHEYYNLIENSDGRYYGYCPPHDNIDISNLGTKSSDSSIEDVIVIYTNKIKNSSDRVIVAFTDSATIHRQRIYDEKLERTINQNGQIIHCSYSIESDYLYNLESYPHKFIIEISKYNTYMFRQQRFFKGKYISLDKKIISYLEKYLENAEFIDDELYQDEIQAKEITGKEKLMNTFDVKPQWAETGGSMMVKKNAAYAKQALVNSNFLCEADTSHHTFMTSKGVPYMEGHHLIPCTAKNAKAFWKRVGKSIDCVENIVCLCPTCHRRIHFGSEAEKRSIIKLLYNKQHSKLKKAGLDISEKELIGLYLRQS